MVHYFLMPLLFAVSVSLVISMRESVDISLLINFSNKLMPSTQSVAWKRLPVQAGRCPGSHSVWEGKTAKKQESSTRQGGGSLKPTQQIREKSRPELVTLIQYWCHWRSGSPLLICGSSGRIGEQSKFRLLFRTRKLSISCTYWMNPSYNLP